MPIKSLGLNSQVPRNPGEKADMAGPDRIVSKVVEGDDIIFGDAVMVGTAGRQVKQFSGASGVFAGVAMRGTNASDIANDKYEELDLLGVKNLGSVSVFVEEEIAIGDTVRVRHTAKAAAAGTATLSSAPTTFVGATVHGIATATYDIDIEVDGTNYALTLAVVITDDWDALAADLQVALRAATSALETVAISAGLVLVTSATTGVASSVRIRQGTTGSAAGDLIDIINGLTGYLVTVDTPTDGTLFPVGGFATTAEAGKTAVITGAEFIEASGFVDEVKSQRTCSIRLDGPFTVTADT